MLYSAFFPKGNILVLNAVSDSMGVDLTIYKFSFCKVDSWYYSGLWMEVDGNAFMSDL